MFSLQELAEKIDIEYRGPEITITAMNTLKDATQSEISFVSNSKYVADISTTKAAAVILNQELAGQLPDGCIALITDEPYLMMAKLSSLFAPSIEEPYAKAPEIGMGSVVSMKAQIENGVVIGENCHIMAGVYVGTNCTIGDNVTLYPNVVIYRDCHIGNDCIIHAGSAIGSDGFGFATTKLGTHLKIYQNGNAVVEDDVEIGANSTIDRAVFGTTRIQKGVRIDNLVQIGHNCDIGEFSVIVAQAGLAGSSILGRNVVMGGQSATSGHLSIAPFSTFAARSGITKSITQPHKTYAGFPLMDHRMWLKLQGKIARLLKS
ncbi:MAG TPA: UDP-3-O-(3-hydroxymyristoyl)glucosamine N-acyltransferase [Helicobacteraceae bacterium]|nr:UDP-3-O-(3-hydroxymyristoyl)glucosamine N-acyltransferase [Helicobacteraceae bacterium]